MSPGPRAWPRPQAPARSTLPVSRTLPCAVLLLAAFLLAFAGPAEARRFALLVGNNLGGPDLDTLRHAEKDARRMADVLTRLSGFDPADVTLLAGVDSAGLEKAFGEMRSRVSAPGAGLDALFLFYYSGHSDRAGLRLGARSYPLERLRDNLAAVPGQVRIGVFDACQSGLMTRFKGGSISKPVSLESLRDIEGQVIISSSSMDEKSQESDQLQGSIFTHHWVNGLSGSADLNADRRVTLSEAYQYAYNMTVQTTSRTRWGVQHPAYQFRIHGEGDIVLADLNLGRSGLVFKPALEGKYLILDRDQERLVADFHKPAGKNLLISLKGGDYQVVKVERGAWKVADARVPENRSLEFDASALKARAQVVNPIKGRLEEGEYHVAFGPVEHEEVRVGASRKWGMSLKVGEGTGLAGLALVYNRAPEIQFQLGGGYYPAVYNPYNASVGSAFLMARKYEGVYFIDAGLAVKTVGLRGLVGEVLDSREATRFGWEAGLPVHVGIELGPRRSVFATLSLGYLWIFTGGGDLLKTLHGSYVDYIHTTESGISMGAAFGFYLF